jgi:hypothetical protein
MWQLVVLPTGWCAASASLAFEVMRSIHQEALEWVERMPCLKTYGDPNTPVLLGARWSAARCRRSWRARGTFVALASHTLLTEDEEQPVVAEAKRQPPQLDFLREQMQGLLGWNMQVALSDPAADLLLTSESEGHDEWTTTEKPARHQSTPPAMAWRMTLLQHKGEHFND